jgi:hypothetical protein
VSKTIRELCAAYVELEKEIQSLKADYEHKQEATNAYYLEHAPELIKETPEWPLPLPKIVHELTETEKELNRLRDLAWASHLGACNKRREQKDLIGQLEELILHKILKKGENINPAKQKKIQDVVKALNLFKENPLFDEWKK